MQFIIEVNRFMQIQKCWCNYEFEMDKNDVEWVITRIPHQVQVQDNDEVIFHPRQSMKSSTTDEWFYSFSPWKEALSEEKNQTEACIV